MASFPSSGAPHQNPVFISLLVIVCVFVVDSLLSYMVHANEVFHFLPYFYYVLLIAVYTD